MRILIAYYSTGGSTRKLAEALKSSLEKRGHSIDLEKITPLQEHNFWGWLYQRWSFKKCEIQPLKFPNASPYDAILIGSPNWTGLSLPVAQYLKQIKGLQGKEVSLFSTTAAPPALEWYFISAYLLDLSFSQLIEQKNGRPKNDIMLSSVFKKLSVNSEYGQNLIEKFCQKIEAHISSLKHYFLEKREIEGIRFLAVFLSSTLLLSFVSQVFLLGLGIRILNWRQYSLVGIIMLLAFLLLTFLKTKERGVLLGKYIGATTVILLWTITIDFVHPDLGRLIIWGYFFIFTIVGSFRNRKLIIFTTLATALSYTVLYLNYPLSGVLLPALDLLLILSGSVIVTVIAMSLQKHFVKLLEAQEEIETTKAALELKVAERTKELKELTDSLDSQVKEKTKNLEEKIEELERFNKLVVGRELKMVELKQEIEKLKSELGKTKS